MELDFTKLNSLAFAGFTEIPPEKQPSKTPSEPFLEDGRYKTPPEEENAVQGQIEGLQGISYLQREADSIKEERERAKAVYRKYQQNIKTSGQLQTALLKGARQGEDIYSLFLKAVKAISLMTSNTAFYSQIEEDIKAIYGAGLLEPKPLELELEEVEGRLQRLREASQRETEPADSLQRIASAIKAHEQRATQLKGMLAQGGESLTA